MDSYIDLYITRHGQSQGNLRFANNEEAPELSEEERRNPPLTELGHRQSFLLGERLAPCDFDAVIVSPLYRAVQTAIPIVTKQTGKSANRIELMSEIMEVGNSGDYRGTPLEKLKNDFPDIEFIPVESDSPLFSETDENEDRDLRLLRAQNVISYIKKRFTYGASILIVAHGTFNHSLTTAAINFPLVDNFNFCSENTALTKVRYFENGRTRLSYSDDLSHLIPEFPHHTFSL